MKKLIIFLIVFLFLASFVSACAKPSSETPTQETPAPTSDPSFYLDSDGDGMSDWFEENIAYNPDVSNDRYFILFYHYDYIESSDIDLPAQFLIEKGKVPPENIFKLAQEEATASALQNAIEQIAEKSDRNDIVYLGITAHGPGTIGVTLLDVSFCAADRCIKYVELNEWLNQIEAKALILSISSCGDELAVPVLKEGSCPRIVYLHAGGEFLRMFGFGVNDDAAQAIVTYSYSNDPYISVGEAADYLDDQRVYLSDWNITRERKNAKRIATYKKESGYHVPDESKAKILAIDSSGYVRAEIESDQYPYTALVDPFNIAYEIFLTDYKIPS